MVTEEEIAELMKTPEGMQILRSMMEDQDEGEAMTAASGYDNDGNWVGGGMEPMPPVEIGASPDTLGATRGLPPEQIGASPDIPGATRGLPLGVQENDKQMGPETFPLIESLGIGARGLDTNDKQMGSETFPLIESLGIGARGLDTPAEREFRWKMINKLR